MCVNVTVVGQGHPKLVWCNASVRSTNVPYMKSISKEPTCKGT